MKIPRFRIYTPNRDCVHKCHTMRQVEEWLLQQDMGLMSFMVEDIKDDIEVDADDILEAYREGERYDDLQGF